MMLLFGVCLLLFSCNLPLSDKIIILQEEQRCIAVSEAGSELFNYNIEQSEKTINKAIQRLSKGGQLFLQTGNYFLQSPIELKSDIEIVGDIDYLTKIISHQPTLIHAKNVSGVVLANFTLKGVGKVGNSIDSLPDIHPSAIFFSGDSKYNVIKKIIIEESNGGGIGFQGKGCQHNVVEKCIIRDCRRGYGIGIGGGGEDIVIEDNEIERTMIHGIIVWGGGKNCMIRGNSIYESGYYRPDTDEGYFCHGIATDGGAGKFRGVGHHIIGNKIFDSGAAGIEVADGVDSVVIRDNYIRRTGVKAPWDKYGIYFGGSYKPGVYAEIVNNRVFGSAWSGIRVDSNYGRLGYTSEVRVDSNVVAFSSKHGILIGSADKIKIRQNNISKILWNGIHIEGLDQLPANNILIEDNIISEIKGNGIFTKNTTVVEMNNNLISEAEKENIRTNKP